MKHERMIGVRTELDGTDISRRAAAVTLCLLVLCACFIRQRYWLMTGGFEPDYLAWANRHDYGGVSESYTTIAGQIYRGAWAQLSQIYPPGYPALIALARLLGVEDLQHFRLVQGFADAGACVLAYHVLRRLRLQRISALLGSALYAVLPWLGWGSALVMGESLIPALALAVLALMLRARDKQRTVDWVLLGCCGVLMPLFRAEFTLLVVPLVVWALVAAQSGNRLRAGLACAAGFLVPWLALAMANYFLHGNFFVSNNVKYYALFSGLGQLPNEFGYYADDVRADQRLHAMGLRYHSAEAEDYWRQVYFDAWLERPGYVLQTILHRFYLIWFETDYFGSTASNWAHILYLAPRATLAAILVLAWRRQYAAILIVLGPVGLAMWTLGAVYVESRYVRYATLSHVLGVAVVFDAIWLGLLAPVARYLDSTGPPASTRRLAFRTLVGAALVLGAWGVYSETRAVYRNARMALIDRALADKIPDKPFEQLDGWQAVVPGATIERQGTVIVVNISPTVVGYQAMASIKGTQKYDAISLIYEVEMDGEKGMFGLLQRDHRAFRFQRPLVPAGATRVQVTVPIDDAAVHGVFAMDYLEGGSKVFRISSFRYALSCVDIVPATLLDRLRHVLFPLPARTFFANCD
jgi:Dolichyl-phosphate-mannose-protein mannosyltransferase